jgi:methanogenic corrinoid protein MtbC1
MKRLPLVRVTHEDVVDFAELLLADDPVAISVRVDSWRARGMSVETIFLSLFTESARYLGSLWGSDTCNFCEVTMGMWRLQMLLHELSPAFQCEGGPVKVNGQRVLLSPVVGEQHTFGLLLVAEFFRRDGWDVCGHLPAANEHLIDSVRAEWVDLVGLSASGDTTFGDLAALVQGVRQASMNPDVGVMVGGQVFMQKPELALAVGADFAAGDASDAVLFANHLIARIAKNRPSLGQGNRGTGD